MKTSEAVRKIRKGLGLNQREFAQRLKVNAVSISRYESGGQEPSQRVIVELATIAGEAGLSHLAELFSAKRKSSIASRVEKLSRPGAARTVPRWQLAHWSSKLILLGGTAYFLPIEEQALDLAARLNDVKAAQAVKVIQTVLNELGREMYSIVNDIEQYLGEDLTDLPAMALRDLNRLKESNPRINEFMEMIEQEQKRRWGRKVKIPKI